MSGVAGQGGLGDAFEHFPGAPAVSFVRRVPGDFQQGAEVLGVGGEKLFRQLLGAGGVARVKPGLEEQVQGFGVVFEVGDFFQGGQGVGGLAGALLQLRLQEENLGVVRRQRGGLLYPLQGFVGMAALQGVLTQAAVDLGGLRPLAVVLVEVGQALLDLDVGGVEVEHLGHDFHGLLGGAAFQVGFGQLHVLGPGVGHQALHAVEVGQPFHGVGVGGVELGDLLVHRDPAHQEAVADVDVGELGVVGQGLGDVVEAGVEVAQGVQGVLVLGFFPVNLLVLGDSFLELALREKLLRRFDGFGFVNGHRESPKTRRGENALAAAN